VTLFGVHETLFARHETLYETPGGDTLRIEPAEVLS
jgi:hypothetical protein